MDDDARSALLAELSAELDMPIDTIGTLLDEAAALEVVLADWAVYEERLPGIPPWRWHPQTLFHGGCPGLRVGELILPPDVTGVRPATDYAEYKPGVYRSDRVYMTTDVEQARQFAALHPQGTHALGGDVYRVVPLQGLAHDRDCKVRGMSWQAPLARVVGIVATSIRRAPYLKAIDVQKEIARTKEEPLRRLRPFTPGPR